MATIPTTAVKSADEERWRNSSVYTEIMVSSFGRIKEREYQKVMRDKDGSFRIYATPAKLIQPSINKVTGDIMVSFHGTNGSWINESVDFLVAKEFVRNEDPIRYDKVKHLDGNKTNVKASNLIWGSHGVSGLF